MGDFADKLQNYLATPENKRDIAEGGLLLLQLNRNQVFYNNLMRRPDRLAPKLYYELDKYAAVYLKKVTATKTSELVDSAAQVDVSPAREVGQRADHEQLPEEIKNRWVENLPLLQELRGYHAKLKLATTDCDRYELAQLILEIDKRYRKNYEAYDKYIVGKEKEQANNNGDVIDEERVDDPIVDAKTINSARAYISRNKKKLAKLKDTEDPGYSEFLGVIQERANQLVQANSITEELKNELIDLGIKF